MAVYYVLLLVPLMVQHFTVRKRDINYQMKNNVSLLFFFILLTLLVMLRHETVGTDTANYIIHFFKFSKTKWSDLGQSSSEVGYSFYIKLITVFTKNPQIFLVVTTVLTFSMIIPTYKRLCTDPSLTIVLYCLMSTFVMAFSGIRQMLAVAMGVLAYELVRNKKLIPFILCVIVAMTFHISAFMIAFMYPLYHARITKKWLFVVIPVMAIIFVFNSQIFTAFAFILERFTKYDGSIEQTGAYTMLMLFVIFAVFAFLIPNEELLDDETIGLRNFLLLSVILQMFAPLHAIAMRMNYYYIIFIPLLLPKIISARSKKWEDVAVLARHVMVAFFALYFFYNAYTANNNLRVFPYHFFWEVVR